MKSSTSAAGFLWAALAMAALGTMGAPVAYAQDADAPEATVTAAEEAAEDGAALEQEEPAAEEGAAAEDATADEAVAEDAAPDAAGDGPEPPASDEPAADETAAEEPAAEDAGAGEPANDEAADEAAATQGIDFRAIAIAIALIVAPIYLGNAIAKGLRMKEHGWKIGLVLFSIAAAALCVAMGEFKGGPDLAGGITLIYEMSDPTAVVDGDEEEEADAKNGQRKVSADEMISALKQRIDPAGTKEVTIRQYGDAIEIIIPKAGPDDLEFVKRRITDLGQLEFRITADPTYSDDQPIIKQAELAAPSEKIVRIGEREVAEWVLYDVDKFGESGAGLVTRQAGDRLEALVLRDPFNVTGEYLASTAKSVDEIGAPTVAFRLNSSGASRFGKLTGDNLPNQATGAKRKLGIMLDKRLISAPQLNGRISESGQISGINDEREVDYIISILNAGSLPAALNKTPISEETVSPTLGATTIEMGKQAIAVSLGAVLLFILFYYRFAGIVACIALALTLLMVLGVMVLIQAAFTLPGLAGLVLTVGMSVDANVLIFERIREELAKGAGLRTAIRNGFGRATTTIVDANITTLITGIVLYSIGTDQIKGFAVTLILGILMSMYTAIFVSRLIFDIAERCGWIKNLSFASIVGNPGIDFIGKRGVALVLSLALISLGLVGVFSRGSDLLDIDFTGGSSVTMALKPENAATIAEVRETLEQTELVENNLLIVERGETGTRFTVNSSIEDVDEAESILDEAFQGKLQTYSVEIGESEPFTEEGGFSGTQTSLTFNDGEGFSDDDGLSHDTLVSRLQKILADQGQGGVLPLAMNPNLTPGSSQRFKEWDVRLGLPAEASRAVFDQLKGDLESQAVFPLANKIGGKVAGNMQLQAISAILVSLLCIVAYLWFRFQNVYYGVAAVIALVHDVLITLGALAGSAWLVSGMPPLATALQLDAFQISLPIVAAFITIIGYSLNDTIVVFDRIREVKGKSPELSNDIINSSVNQTLARTLLTSLTTLIVVAILYFAGGPGIHAFAFALVIGVLVGTYSSIFVASPALLWLTGGKIIEHTAEDQPVDNEP
ncbi:bifunctional preprotein translocase subunit SecD/SecF [Pseudobythopirellula maris]|uniref:Multifunctional fusion protein n=1 Tax=Pseudobythopirellula maris TaxID=2527991 RepID=A0A5C5ZGK0_9BACT|nr:protein translocase subunit SecD [Pseudobythopirellula maris]TWT86187.1 bifunctional preprotein translocase subunit SecD/SecF [Pseudobythopirellula maris]